VPLRDAIGRAGGFWTTARDRFLGSVSATVNPVANSGGLLT
jgi:hypothetical protein